MLLFNLERKVSVTLLCIKSSPSAANFCGEYGNAVKPALYKAKKDTWGMQARVAQRRTDTSLTDAR
jgi:hypothetical protein